MIRDTNPIERSEIRPFIDERFLAGDNVHKVSMAVHAKYGVCLSSQILKDYRDFCLANGSSPLQQVIKVTENLAKNDMPPQDGRDAIAQHFSFNRDATELDMLYERIRKLMVLADEHPENPTYDRRAKEWMAHTEAIRMRVYKFQYEQVRRAILVTVGKKLVLAAVSILLPYIPVCFREEALKRFQNAIEPLLDARELPDTPVDISSGVVAVSPVPAPTASAIDADPLAVTESPAEPMEPGDDGQLQA